MSHVSIRPTGLLHEGPNDCTCIGILNFSFLSFRVPQGSEVQQNQGLAAGFLQTTEEPQHAVSICRPRLSACTIISHGTCDLGTGVRLLTERQQHPVGKEAA